MKEKKKEMRKQRELYERKLTAKQKLSQDSPKESSLNQSLNQSAFDYSLEDLEVSGINFQTTKLRMINSFCQD